MSKSRIGKEPINKLPTSTKPCKECGADVQCKVGAYYQPKFCGLVCRNKSYSKIGDSRKSKEAWKTCKVCSKVFYSKHWKSRDVKYCSVKCFGTTLKVEIPCKQCGNLIDGKGGAVNGRMYCSSLCRTNSRRGTKLTAEHKLALSQGRKNSPKCRGSNLYNWKGGQSNPNIIARGSAEIKKWREAVYARDGYTCQICGVKGGKLNADHIKPFAYYKDLRYDINNGRTLCVDCHKKTDTFGAKALKYKVIV